MKLRWRLLLAFGLLVASLVLVALGYSGHCGRSNFDNVDSQ